jgi:hypothetical protein
VRVLSSFNDGIQGLYLYVLQLDIAGLFVKPLFEFNEPILRLPPLPVNLLHLSYLLLYPLPKLPTLFSAVKQLAARSVTLKSHSLVIFLRHTLREF